MLCSLQGKFEEERRAARAAVTAKEERLAAAETEVEEALKRAMELEAMNTELKARLQSLGDGGSSEGHNSNLASEVLRLKAELQRSEERRTIDEGRRSEAEKKVLIVPQHVV